MRKGLLGEVPQTLWLMDYPLFERTYYGLVVNFNVFGNVSHQAQTRLYFDLIRNGAEQNFLRLMPVDARQPLLDDWYQNSGKLKMWMDYQAFDDDTPSALGLPEKQPKKAFAEELLRRYGDLNARPDPINRCLDGNCYRPGIDRELQDAEQAFSRLVSRPAAGLKVIERFPRRPCCGYVRPAASARSIPCCATARTAMSPSCSASRCATSRAWTP